MSERAEKSLRSRCSDDWPISIPPASSAPLPTCSADPNTAGGRRYSGTEGPPIVRSRRVSGSCSDDQPDQWYAVLRHPGFRIADTDCAGSAYERRDGDTMSCYDIEGSGIRPRKTAFAASFFFSELVLSHKFHNPASAPKMFILSWLDQRMVREVTKC